MLIKNNFSKDSIKSKNYIKNLKKTKISFKSLLKDLENFEIPLIESFEKNYKLDFPQSLVKKFSRYQNIIIIGMGGSVLGTKSIYSFLKYKIKKNVFFFDNLDPNLYLQYKKINKLKNSCFIVVSKSGNTLETITNLCAVFSEKLLKNKLIIITEIKDSALINIGNKYNAEIISHQEFIGGRYSDIFRSDVPKSRKTPKPQTGNGNDL